MAFNKDKYQYVDHIIKSTNSREIIAIGQYCGQTIKGHARCNPEDTFDVSVIGVIPRPTHESSKKEA